MNMDNIPRLKPDNTIYWYDAHRRLSLSFIDLERRAYDMQDALERALVALKLSAPVNGGIETGLRHEAAIIAVNEALKEALP